MGLMLDGEWVSEDVFPTDDDGNFTRDTTQFRNWVSADGSSGFKAESGRYHLYVAHACPWAHRTLIFRAIRGLEAHIGVSVVHPEMMEDGWSFETGFGATGDTLMGKNFLREVYLAADPEYTGRVTVPVLWDTQRETIVSNESAEIIRMLDTEFDALLETPGSHYPAPLREEIDAVNERVYDTVNNGVYMAGFATSQGAYDHAVSELFVSLDWLENRLSHQRYLVGDQITEADWRLFTTLLRFDAVYHTHFKCNRRKIAEYPALFAYARELYQVPGVAGTVEMEAIKRHYYRSHPQINPHRIIATGPETNWMAPHGRDAMGGAQAG